MDNNRIVLNGYICFYRADLAADYVYEYAKNGDGDTYISMVLILQIDEIKHLIRLAIIKYEKIVLDEFQICELTLSLDINTLVFNKNYQVIDFKNKRVGEFYFIHQLEDSE